MAMKSLSIIGTKGPYPSADVLRAAFRLEKGSERRHEREVPDPKVDNQECSKPDHRRLLDMRCCCGLLVRLFGRMILLDLRTQQFHHVIGCYLYLGVC